MTAFGTKRTVKRNQNLL